MTESLYPNKQALHDALDIFRYAMRPFIVRCLNRVKGKNIEEAIKGKLGGRGKYFSDDLRRTGSAEESIDINDFPKLVDGYWNDIFSQEFWNDEIVKNMLWMIRDARNKAAHPSQSDLDIEDVRSRVTVIADLLGRINESDSKQAVERIRDRLSSPPPLRDTTTRPLTRFTEPASRPPQQDPPVPSAPSPSREKFYVYTDGSNSKIHKGPCYHYENRKPDPLPDNWWHGPYSSEAEAEAKAWDATQNRGRVTFAERCR